MAVVIKGLMIWGSPKQFPCRNSAAVCDGYVKYEEAKVDRLVAILKTNTSGGGGFLRMLYPLAKVVFFAIGYINGHNSSYFTYNFSVSV